MHCTQGLRTYFMGKKVLNPKNMFKKAPVRCQAVEADHQHDATRCAAQKVSRF